MDIITLFAGMQFVDNPLESLVNLYNHLKEGGVLMAHYPYPVAHQDALGTYYELLSGLVKLGAAVECRTVQDIQDASYLCLQIVIVKNNNRNIRLNLTPDHSVLHDVIPERKDLSTKVVYYKNDSGRDAVELVSDKREKDSQAGEAAVSVTPALQKATVDAYERLVEMIKYRGRQDRRTATIALRGTKDRRAIRALIALLNVDDLEIRLSAISALKGAQDTEAEEALLALLNRCSGIIREEATSSLEGSKDPKVIKTLTGLLRDPEPDIRAKAARSLKGTQDPDAVNALARLLNEQNWHVKINAAESLIGTKEESKAVKTLIALVASSDKSLRQPAIEDLKGAHDPEAMKTLLGLLNDPDMDIQKAAIESIREMRNPEVVKDLTALLNRPDTRMGAIRSLKGTQDPDAVNALTRLLDEQEWYVKIDAAESLMGTNEEPRAAQCLSRLLRDTSYARCYVRKSAIEAMKGGQSREATELLIELLKDSEDRVEAVRSLEGTKDPNAIKALKELLADINPDVRREAARSLKGARESEIVNALGKRLSDEHWSVRSQAMGALMGTEEEPRVIRILTGLLDDRDPKVRETAIETLSNIIASEPSRAAMDLLNSDYEKALPGVKSVVSGYNQTLPPDKRADVDMFLDDMRYPLMMIHRFSQTSDAELLDILKGLLERRGFIGLYHLLNLAQNIDRPEMIGGLLKTISDKGQKLEALRSLADAKVVSWWGRSAVVPLDIENAVVVKFLRPDEGRERLEREAVLMKELDAAAEPIPTGNGGYLFQDNSSLSPQLPISPERWAIQYRCGMDWLDYLNDPLPWLSYSERVSRIKEAHLRNMRQMADLHNKGFYHKSILALFHDFGGEEDEWDPTHERGVGNIIQLNHGLRYPNLRMAGLADYQHVEEGRPRRYVIQNLFEADLCLSHAGIVNDIKDEDISNIAIKGGKEYYRRRVGKDGDVPIRSWTYHKTPPDVRSGLILDTLETPHRWQLLNNVEGLYLLVNREISSLETPPSGAGCASDSGSPAECLETIKKRGNEELFARARDKEETGGIKVSEIAKLRPYHSRTVYREFEILKDIGVFVPVEGKPHYYRFSDMMLGDDENYTKTLINMINDIRYRISKGGDERVLYRGNIPKEKRPFVKELVKMQITNFVHTQIGEAKTDNEPYRIKIWKGYGTLTQQGLMTKIEKMTKKKPYQVSFERDVENLVNYACAPDNLNDRTVTILPLDKNILTPDQRKRLEGAKARVIFVNLDEKGFGAFDSAPLEGLIATGRAYLNNDEIAFYRLYELLAQPESYNPIPLVELKNNPILFIDRLKFTLKPIIAHNPDELKAVNERMERLLQFA